MSVVSLPHKIIVGVDGSEQSYKAVSYATTLAAISKSSLVALHVILLPMGASPKTVDVVKKDLASKGQQMLERAEQLAKTKDVPIEKRITETDHSVQTAIVDFAKREGADLIVVGTQGTAGYPRLMLGSTAAGTVSFVNCSVLAVR